jgi:hypothetical protein
LKPREPFFYYLQQTSAFWCGVRALAIEHGLSVDCQPIASQERNKSRNNAETRRTQGEQQREKTRLIKDVANDLAFFI